MTTQQLLDVLRKQLDEVHAAIRVVESVLSNDSHSHKKRAILKSIKKSKLVKKYHKNKGKSYHGTHWMQTPEGKIRLSKAMKNSWKKRKENTNV